MYFFHSWTYSFYATWLERARKRKSISRILLANVVLIPLCTSLGNFEFTPCWELMGFVLEYWLGISGCSHKELITTSYLSFVAYRKLQCGNVFSIGWRKSKERWFIFSWPLFGVSNCCQNTKENCLSHSKDLVRFEQCNAGKLYYDVLIIFSFQIRTLLIQIWS